MKIRIWLFALLLNSTPIFAVDEFEHEIIDGLVETSQATLVSAVNRGVWHRASSWEQGRVPADNDRVYIKPGHTILVKRQETSRIKSIRTEGTLLFKASRNTRLFVDTLFVAETGRLEIGRAGVPVTRSAEIVFIDDVNGFNTDNPAGQDYDPIRIGRGLISLGTVSVLGKEVTPYVAFDGAPAGENQVVLDTIPTNWQIGDRVVIASTNDNWDGDETRGIAALDNNVLTFDEPLSLDHTTPQHSANVDLKVHIANLERNVTFRTEEGNEMSTSVIGNTEIFDSRGHIMLHTNNVDWRYAAQVNLGRTNKTVKLLDDTKQQNGVVTHVGTNNRARYALHFHRAGLDGVGHVEGTVTVGSPGWAFVNHSSNADFINNVSYKIVGAGFVTEASPETGSFVRNLALRTGHKEFSQANTPYSNRITADNQSFGFDGDGFWFQGLHVDINDNIAAGFTGDGFGFKGWAIDIGDGPNSITVPTSTSRDPSRYSTELTQAKVVAIRAFNRNTAYSGGEGLTRWNTNPSRVGLFHEYRDFTAWRVKRAIDSGYNAGDDFERIVLIRGSDTNNGVGFGSHLKLHNGRYGSAHVEGFAVGIELYSNYLEKNLPVDWDSMTFVNNTSDVIFLD